MIIVEGCDNTGKSTLVQKLSGDLKLLTINNRRRPESISDSWDYLYAVAPLAARFPTIADRWQPISEPIYGPICRNTQIFSLREIELQHEYLTSWDALKKPTLIFCRPPLDRILQFGTREQMEGVIDNARRIVSAYDTEMARLEHHTNYFNIVRWDFAHDSYDDLLSRVRELEGQ